MSKKLIVSIIIVGLILIMVADFKINGVKVFQDYFEQFETSSWENLESEGNFALNDENSASRDGIKTLNNDIDFLSIDNKIGSVEIKGEDRDDISLDYIITVFADNEAHAKAFINEVELIEEIEDKKLKFELKVNNKPDYIRAIRVDYDIKMPREISLKIYNNNGEVEVEDIIGDAELRNYYSSLRLLNLNGDAKIISKYGNVYIDKINGNVNLDVSFNKVELNDISNDIKVRASQSMVNLENLKGNAELFTKYGGLFLKNIHGDIFLESKYTEIDGDRLQGELKGNLRYGDMELFNIENNVELSAAYADLEVNMKKEIQDYALNCQSTYGKIYTDLPYDVKKGEDSLKYLNQINGSGDVKIDLETEHADIKIYQRDQYHGE